MSISRSKTAINPVNVSYLPRSTAEREQCSRTIYVSNLDTSVDLEQLRAWFQKFAGKCFLRCGQPSATEPAYPHMSLRSPVNNHEATQICVLATTHVLVQHLMCRSCISAEDEIRHATRAHQHRFCGAGECSRRPTVSPRMQWLSPRCAACSGSRVRDSGLNLATTGPVTVTVTSHISVG